VAKALEEQHPGCDMKARDGPCCLPKLVVVIPPAIVDEPKAIEEPKAVSLSDKASDYRFVQFKVADPAKEDLDVKPKVNEKPKEEDYIPLEIAKPAKDVKEFFKQKLTKPDDLIETVELAIETHSEGSLDPIQQVFFLFQLPIQLFQWGHQVWLVWPFPMECNLLLWVSRSLWVSHRDLPWQDQLL
jgi:hypothetical protein